MMVNLDLRVLLCWKKRLTDCLKVLARSSRNKTWKCKNKSIFFFLERMWICCLVYAKKDDPLDKYKFKLNNRYSSWNEVWNIYYLNDKNTKSLFLCVYCELWTHWFSVPTFLIYILLLRSSFLLILVCWP